MKTDFEVGDVVRIRSWEDMEHEFGIVPGGDSIDCQYQFTPDMEPLCGLEAEITSYFKATGNVQLKFMQQLDNADLWNYSTDMIELMSFEIPESKELDEFLSGFLR